MESGTWGWIGWESALDVLSVVGALLSILLGAGAIGLALHLYRRNDQVFRACTQLLARLEVTSLERTVSLLPEPSKEDPCE